MRIHFLLMIPLLAACNMSPERIPAESLDIEVPESWYASYGEGDVDNSRWWLSFEDEMLAKVVTKGVENSRSLKIAAARVEAAGAQLEAVTGQMYPALDLGITGTRRVQNFIGFPIPGGGNGVLTSRSNTFGLSLNLSWELDLWGRVRSQVRSATAAYEASEADALAARESLAAQIVKMWYSCVEARLQTAAAEEAQGAAKMLEDALRERFERGLVPAEAYLNASIQRKSRDAAQSQRRDLQQKLTRQLEIVIGDYPANALELADSLPEIANDVAAGMPAQLVTRRWDVVRAERQLAATEMSVSAARAALFPRLSLSGSGGTSTESIKDLLDGDFSVWNIAGNILQPIFHGGTLLAQLDESASKRDQALHGYAIAVLQAFYEVESLIDADNYSKQATSELTSSFEDSSANFDRAKQRYEQGVTNTIDFLQAKLSFLDAKSRHLQALNQRIAARVDLHLSLGGGFE
ncbi:MAG: efflux transporter outer membrane subunit [Planctomycetes bacterium]|nr:efflux transporter outer membrane subunit [Planctomycetota bacterium]